MTFSESGNECENHDNTTTGEVSSEEEKDSPKRKRKKNSLLKDFISGFVWHSYVIMLMSLT